LSGADFSGIARRSAVVVSKNTALPPGRWHLAEVVEARVNLEEGVLAYEKLDLADAHHRGELEVERGVVEVVRPGQQPQHARFVGVDDKVDEGPALISFAKVRAILDNIIRFSSKSKTLTHLARPRKN
jgi:hypothetical protein